MALSEGVKLLAILQLYPGHIGKPRSGIIELKSGSNSQGLVDIGIKTDCTGLLKDIQQQIKGLVVLGEDINKEILEKLDFLLVQDTHMTEAAEHADIILPAASAVESMGTYTSSERRIQA